MLRSLPVWLSADVQTFGDAFPRTELWSIQIQDWTNLSNKPRWTNRVHLANVPFSGLRSVGVTDTETEHQRSSCFQHLCPWLPTQWCRCLPSWLAAIVTSLHDHSYPQNKYKLFSNSSAELIHMWPVLMLQMQHVLTIRGLTCIDRLQLITNGLNSSTHLWSLRRDYTLSCTNQWSGLWCKSDGIMINILFSCLGLYECLRVCGINNLLCMSQITLYTHVSGLFSWARNSWFEITLEALPRRIVTIPNRQHHDSHMLPGENNAILFHRFLWLQ